MVMVSLLLFAGGVCLLLGALVLRATLRSRRRNARTDHLPDMAAEILMAAEEATASLDSRISRLEELIAAADERLTALRHTLARQGGGEGYPSPGAAGPPAAPPVPSPPAEPLPSGPVEPAGTPPGAAAPAPFPQEAPPSAVPPADVPALHRQVWELAAAGLDGDAISRELHLPRGQVDLILGLRRLRGAGEAGGEAGG